MPVALDSPWRSDGAAEVQLVEVLQGGREVGRLTEQNSAVSLAGDDDESQAVQRPPGFQLILRQRPFT